MNCETEIKLIETTSTEVKNRLLGPEEMLRAIDTGALYVAGPGGVPQAMVTARSSGSGVEPRGIAPSGTVAADGTITLGTALPATFPQITLYLPAGAISGGAAGFYCVEMSSATVGVVRDRFGGAALTGSGSAYTGVTTEVTASQSVFSWRQIQGQVLTRAIGLCNNSAGTKTYRSRIGATQVNSAAPASQLGFGAMLHLHGLGGPLVSAINALAAGGTNTAAIVTATEGQDVIVSHTLQLATATDYAILVATLDMVI